MAGALSTEPGHLLCLRAVEAGNRNGGPQGEGTERGGNVGGNKASVGFLLTKPPIREVNVLELKSVLLKLQVLRYHPAIQ